MYEFEELMALRMMLGNSGGTWILVALIVGILVTLIFRPERIRSSSMLMIGGLCVALSLVVPPIVSWLTSTWLESMSNDYGGSRYRTGRQGGGGANMSQLMMLIPMMAGPALQAAAMLFVFMSLMPGNRRRSLQTAPLGSIPGQSIGGGMGAGPVAAGLPPVSAQQIQTASVEHGQPRQADGAPQEFAPDEKSQHPGSPPH